MITTTQTAAVGSKIQTYFESRRRGTEFLLRHVNPDGSIGPVERGIYYYRVPWTLALAGETGSAMRVTEWIRRYMLTPDGEVAGDASPNGDANRQAHTYAETCVAYGAQILRQYDVAQQAMRFALRFQDSVTGGVYMDRMRTGSHDPQLLYLTCQLGMSALLTGHIAAAEAAGHFVMRIWAAQPELPQRLYTVYTRGEGIVTQVPADADRRHYVNESQDIRQYHFNGGIAAAFLVRLYLATNDSQWLALARQYQAFSMASTERQFDVMQVCKSAWGAGLLYLVTKEALYRDWTIRLGDWFVANQFPDGHWENSHYIDPNPLLHKNLATTAEFVVHLDTIVGSLSSGLVW